MARRLLRSSTGWIAALLVLAGLGLAIWQLAPLPPRSRAVEAEPSPAALPETVRVSALGRIAPKDGVLYLAGPSDPSVVIARLLVDKGQRVQRGQLVAVLDTYAMRSADVKRIEAERTQARADFDRVMELHLRGVAAESAYDAARTKLAALDAQLSWARAALARSQVRSSVDAQVVEVHAREGERVGPEGILELARTDEMYAIAEVYETDISRVAVGQRALVTSPVLPAELSGVVEHVHLKVSKLDTLGADPIAKTDARVVEVEVRLDDSAAAAPFTNLQVLVRIEP